MAATARVYLDLLWETLDYGPLDLEQVRRLEGRTQGDAQLTNVERASVLEMLKTLRETLGDEGSNL